MKVNHIIHGDCLEVMKDIPDKSVDCIICDLPYGTTACHWDSVIPFEPLWEQYKRIVKDNAAIVLFGSQPFTTDLIMSNRKWFRYELIWNKLYGTNFLLANKQPMKSHENICVFYKEHSIYNPIKTKRRKPKKYYKTVSKSETLGRSIVKPNLVLTEKFPLSVIEENSQNKECNKILRVHPTQKPVALLEYLIKTYTNEGDLILDNCSGSGSTCVAAINTNRKYIGIEKDKTYYELSLKRIKETINKTALFN